VVKPESGLSIWPRPPLAPCGCRTSAGTKQRVNFYGPSGFFLTAALGIGGAIVATFLGRALGLYHAGEGAGFIGATIGAVILLVLYHFIAKKPPP